MNVADLQRNAILSFGYGFSTPFATALERAIEQMAPVMRPAGVADREGEVDAARAYEPVLAKFKAGLRAAIAGLVSLSTTGRTVEPSLFWIDPSVDACRLWELFNQSCDQQRRMVACEGSASTAAFLGMRIQLASQLAELRQRIRVLDDAAAYRAGDDLADAAPAGSAEPRASIDAWMEAA